MARAGVAGMPKSKFTRQEERHDEPVGDDSAPVFASKFGNLLLSLPLSPEPEASSERQDEVRVAALSKFGNIQLVRPPSLSPPGSPVPPVQASESNRDSRPGGQAVSLLALWPSRALLCLGSHLTSLAPCRLFRAGVYPCLTLSSYPLISPSHLTRSCALVDFFSCHSILCLDV